MSSYESKSAVIRANIKPALKIDVRAAERARAIDSDWKEVTAAAIKSLEHLGYSLTTESNEIMTGIEASAGHVKLLMLIENNGRISTDWAGLADGSCEARQRSLEKEMGERGVEFKRPFYRSRHDDPRGGELIAMAGRRRASSLARGILLARGAEKGGGRQVASGNRQRRKKIKSLER
ncbi:MAG: hypothetical protein LBH21_04005 [Gracilibacteraceae bacterium]|jgi:hypothetical protein|nr:hypothetical protein [Gracilibacteraceae bacterium]